MEKEKIRINKTSQINLREGNISLILDSYDDIFSDFDPRPYSEKALSDDFLQECKRAARDKEEQIELILMVPKEKRNHADEDRIKKRLKRHFFNNFHKKEKEIKNMKKEGIIWFILGAIVISIGAVFYAYEGFLSNLIVVISEPAGWFLFWEGLYTSLIQIKEKKPNIEFYKKMTTALISFSSY